MTDKEYTLMLDKELREHFKRKAEIRHKKAVFESEIKALEEEIMKMNLILDIANKEQQKKEI